MITVIRHMCGCDDYVIVVEDSSRRDYQFILQDYDCDANGDGSGTLQHEESFRTAEAACERFKRYKRTNTNL